VRSANANTSEVELPVFDPDVMVKEDEISYSTNLLLQGTAYNMYKNYHAYGSAVS
jgi:hypothetical protein